MFVVGSKSKINLFVVLPNLKDIFYSFIGKQNKWIKKMQISSWIYQSNIYIYMCVCVCVCIERERERERERESERERDL